jgi:hypothetical protein
VYELTDTGQVQKSRIKSNHYSRVLSLHVDTLARGEGSGGVRLDELSELADISEHLSTQSLRCAIDRNAQP